MILDTSVLIALERRRFDLVGFLESIPGERPCIAAITASELLLGCHRATRERIRVQRLAFVDALLQAIPIAEFGLKEARRHSEIWAELSRVGRLIGAYDLMIAATAVARGDAVATLNAREFKRVQGIRLADVDRFAA